MKRFWKKFFGAESQLAESLETEMFDKFVCMFVPLDIPKQMIGPQVDKTTHVVLGEGVARCAFRN